LSINNAAKQLDSLGEAAQVQIPAAPEAAVILTRTAVIVIAAYIGAQMLADIASLKIGIVWGMAVDMGTFIYPITFTLRDVAHKTIGKKPTQTLIWMAAIINLFAAAYLWWVAGVAGDPSWGLNTEWSAVFNASLLWRIVLASIVAEVISEMIDTEIYHWFVTKVSHRHQWARVLTSNSVSVPVDNLIFAVGAFGGVLPWDVVWQIFLFNLLLKYAVTLVSMPLIYVTGDADWQEQ
jgi:queuosine precursor transporter